MNYLNYAALILSTVFTLSLQSAVEYDIIPLQPADHVPKGVMMYSLARDLTESGFITGEMSEDVINENDWLSQLRGFVYHPIRGFEWIDISDKIQPRVINEKGLIVGTLNEPKIFLYDSEEKRLIGWVTPNYFGLPDNTRFTVKSLSNEGHVHVQFHYPVNRAFLFDALDLKTSPKEIPYEIDFVNNSGNMISESDFYTALGEKTSLGFVDPYQRTSPIAQVLNDEDVVAGVAFDESLGQVGFIWDPILGIRSLGNLGGEMVAVNAVNRLSQVVGYAEDGNLRDKAFIYDERWGMKNLGTLGGKRSEAFDINDQGQVVGLSDISKKAEFEHAFIWDEVKGMRDLNALIPQKSGWKVLERARKINNNGSIIGSGIYFGEPMDFLLIPREKQQ